MIGGFLKFFFQKGLIVYPGGWHEAKCVIWKVSVCFQWVLMSQTEFFANPSPLNTVVSRKGIWLILWYFSREFDSKVEIVSSFNEPIYFFSAAIPKGENVINITFPFFWFGFAFALLDYFLFRHENIGKWHCYFHTLSGSMFLEEALLHELKRIFF